MHLRAASPLIALLSLLAATAASAWDQPRIVNGVTSHDFPTTGQLLYWTRVGRSTTTTKAAGAAER